MEVASFSCIGYLTVVFLVSILGWLLIRRRSSLRFPPGPPCIPLLGPIPFSAPKGSAPNVSPDERPIFQRMMDASRTYGDLVGITFIGRRAVFVSSADKLRALWQDAGDAVSGRIRVGMLDFLNPKFLGLIDSEGLLWKEQRRFALHTLRDFGLGKRNIENSILFEIHELLARLDAAEGVPLNPVNAITNATTNVICKLVFNERLAEKPEFAAVSQMIHKDLASIDFNILAIILQRWSLYLPFDLLGMRAINTSYRNVENSLRPLIIQHRATLDPESPRDYIDAFLVEMNACSAESKSSFFFEQLEMSLLDLFAAGEETTSTALRWALLLLAKNDTIQKKVHEEIDRVIGDSEPNFECKSRLPFTESVLNEVLRFGSIVPLAPHVVERPVVIGAFKLPVGTIVLGNLYAILHDPNVWPDADHFNPETNFPIAVSSDEEREAFARRMQNFIPFSVGKRLCLGETLARQELFIFFVGLMQRFRVAASPEHPLPAEYLGTHGITRAPMKFKVFFIGRR